MKTALILVVGAAQTVANSPLHATHPATPAASRLVADAPATAQVRIHPATGSVKLLRIEPESLDLGSARSTDSEESARAFFARHGAAFGISDPGTELKLLDRTVDSLGREHLRYTQQYRGLPVFGAELKVHFDRSGELEIVNGLALPDLEVDPTPAFGLERAASRALAFVRAKGPVNEAIHNVPEDTAMLAGRLLIFRENLLRRLPGANRLVYEIELSDPRGSFREFVYLDAHTGRVVDRITGVHDALSRRAYDAEGAIVPGPNYPASPFWIEGQLPFPTGTLEADNVIYASEETYYLFSSAFGRDSFDGAGATMDAIFNRGNHCPNANWHGTYISFCPGLTTDDITSHEWGHAYTDYTSKLIYQWQPGALSEAYSDIWGEAVDLINGRGTDTPGGVRTVGHCSNFGAGGGPAENSYRWLVGEDATAVGGAVRDMWKPTCYNDPGKVTDSEYECYSSDFGGVHSNSGVPNHAFALLVDGGTYNGQTIAAIGLDKAAAIYWRAQSVYEVPTTGFPEHADALEQSCADLVGATIYQLDTSSPTGTAATPIAAADCTQVANAVAAVELRTPTQCPVSPVLDPNAPDLCTAGKTPQTIDLQTWESGIGAWTAGTRAVENPATFSTPDWAVVGSLPDGRAGSAAFVENNPAYGDCDTDIETGVLYLESPEFTAPPTGSLRLAFDHWVATERYHDGGNVKLSVNGGAWEQIPETAFTFNEYNGSFNFSPLRFEDAFTGTDYGFVTGSWGQSQVDLQGLIAPSDTFELRFEMGLDGCVGRVGWYVDDVHSYLCVGDTCGDGIPSGAEECDDGNTAAGDGCSSTCTIESGWECATPSPGGGSHCCEAGNLTLSNDTLSTSLERTICGPVVLGPNYTIDSTGALMVTSGDRIEFGNGVTVEDAGQFTGDIDCGPAVDG